MKRILFIVTILIFTVSCQKQIDVTQDAVVTDLLNCSGNAETIRISESEEGNVNSSSLNKGLVAYYPFNGNANDVSGNGNNGKAEGTILTTDRFGKKNSAYSFNGYNQINVPHNDMLNITGDLTISAWVYDIGPPNIRNNHTIVCKRSLNEFQNLPYDLSNNYQVGIPTDFKKVMFLSASYAYGYQFLNTITDTYNNVWSQITCVIKNDNIRIYIDGIEALNTLVDNSKRVPNSASLLIGSGARPDLPVEQFIGKIDEVRIYNRALTQNEVSYLATH